MIQCIACSTQVILAELIVLLMWTTQRKLMMVIAMRMGTSMITITITIIMVTNMAIIMTMVTFCFIIVLRSTLNIGTSCAIRIRTANWKYGYQMRVFFSLTPAFPFPWNNQVMQFIYSLPKNKVTFFASYALHK